MKKNKNKPKRGRVWPIFLKKVSLSHTLASKIIIISYIWTNPGHFLIYLHLFKHTLQFLQQINGQWLCGSVGRAVASDTRGPRFESSHRQNLLNICLLSTVYWKDENKEKEAGNGPFFKKHCFLADEEKSKCKYWKKRSFVFNFAVTWAVVVAQLAARSLPIPEDPGSNPVIGNFYWTFIYC